VPRPRRRVRWDGMTPLASVMLLAFLFLIALALVVWALLQFSREATPKREPKHEEAPAARLEPISNDDVRGAKVAAPKRPALPDDAFERFLRAGRDDERG
jgi:Na+-transporting methylmalonyl-CoA/oxaloacetate decarboxylase gamma subunit